MLTIQEKEMYKEAALSQIGELKDQVEGVRFRNHKKNVVEVLLDMKGGNVLIVTCRRKYGSNN